MEREDVVRVEIQQHSRLNGHVVANILIEAGVPIAGVPDWRVGEGTGG